MNKHTHTQASKGPGMIFNAPSLWPSSHRDGERQKESSLASLT